MTAIEPSRTHEKRHDANAMIASALREAAALLKAQDASPFRSMAYLKAATTIENLDEDISEIATGGMEALDAIPNIGKVIGAAILELLSTGRWSQLDRLRGGLEPEAAFRAIPGIGPTLARQIHEHLDVDTLEALETAAHDGRLGKVPGIGPRRLSIIRNALSGMLSRYHRGRRYYPDQSPPSVDLLLSVDDEYRTKAEAGKLRQIAPSRFNPEGKPWLPVLHTERGPWHFTALYSNTARAHELGKTGDWVIIFCSSDHQSEGQYTVVTETSGRNKGKRVVRGRENEQ
ncbi:helix-hairpin-helix domain-containing protein [Parasphingorhabdus sp.]|uniref:helix-hairpin-helix domain-containing protein n=1 Tax=Parasphingorhabdus sp. TaxID=2709688 RepID=UPI003A8DD895